MTRPRHSDHELLTLAADGSASAFASLLHRHRRVLQASAATAEDPERAVERGVIAAMRELPHRDDETPVATWLEGLVAAQAARGPATEDVERIFPSGWFDQLWARVHVRWPHGRRPPRLPRAVTVVGLGLCLVLASAAGTYLVLTSEETSDVVLEISAVPIDGPGILSVTGETPIAEPEEAPELFGDVELGELPTYDLTGAREREAALERTIGPIVPVG